MSLRLLTVCSAAPADALTLFPSREVIHLVRKRKRVVRGKFMWWHNPLISQTLLCSLLPKTFPWPRSPLEQLSMVGLFLCAHFCQTPSKNHFPLVPQGMFSRVRKIHLTLYVSKSSVLLNISVSNTLLYLVKPLSWISGWNTEQKYT